MTRPYKINGEGATLMRDKYGDYPPPNPASPWEPMRKGPLQQTIERDLARSVPDLFRNGPPAVDGKSCRFAISWRRGVVRLYVPDDAFYKAMGPLSRVVRRIKTRYPAIILEKVCITPNTKYPDYQDQFDGTKWA